MVNKITIKALEPFLSRPLEKLHLAQISRELQVPHPTVRLWLRELHKKGILRQERKGRLTLYSLNVDHPLLIDYLVLAEKHRVIAACERWPVLGEFIASLQRTLHAKALVFGSAAVDFGAANDIDVLLVGKEDSKMLKAYAQKLGKDAHLIQVKGLHKVFAALRVEIIKKHLLVRGSEDFVRWMIWQS